MISKPSLWRWIQSAKTSVLRRYTTDRVKAIAPGEPRLELEQAVLRVIISFAILAYVTWYVTRDGVVTGDEGQALFAAFSFFAFAVAVMVRILQAPGVSKARRILGIVVDNSIASYGIFALGEGGAVIFGTYLFVTLGNGFRYGNFYLRISHGLSMVGFATVMLISPFWSQHRVIGIGFLLALLILPLYVGALAERIKEARRRADEANRARERKIAELEEKIAACNRSATPSQEDTSAAA